MEEHNRETENGMTQFNAWMRGRKNAFLRVWNVRERLLYVYFACLDF